MKRITLLFVAIVFSITLFAQNYLSFPDSNASWQIRFWVGPGYPYYYWYNYMNQQNEDTIINTNTYNIIRGVGICSPSGYCGGIRETNYGQVYFIPKDSINEYLLYDFSKNVGDTIYNVYSFLGFFNLKVINKDSFLVANKYQRWIQATCVSGTNNCVGIMDANWIERVGSPAGLLENISMLSVSGSAQLLCMSHNDTTWYMNGYSLGNCLLFSGVGISEITGEKNISLSPNPATNELKIQIADLPAGQAGLKIKEIEIYNLLGEKRLTLNPTPKGGKLHVDVSSLPAGVYFLKVKGEKEEHIAKFVKQ